MPSIRDLTEEERENVVRPITPDTYAKSLKIPRDLLEPALLDPEGCARLMRKRQEKVRREWMARLWRERLWLWFRNVTRLTRNALIEWLSMDENDEREDA